MAYGNTINTNVAYSANASPSQEGTVNSTLVIEDSKGNKTELSNSKIFSEVTSQNHRLDNSDGFIEIVNFSGVKSTNNSVSAPKTLGLFNEGSVPLEIQLNQPQWNAATPDTLGAASSYVSFILPPGSFYYFQSPRFITYDSDQSGALGGSVDDFLPSSESNFNVDPVLKSGTAITDTTSTTLNTASNVTNALRVGDVIQIDSEFFRVDSITDTTNCEVTRGYLGTTAATHAVDKDIYFFVGNILHPQGVEDDGGNNIRTDASGRYVGTPFKTGSIPRNTTNVADGIVAGSFYIKPYDNAYQSLGLTNQKYSDTTGLAANTAYAFNFQTSLATTTNISFTTGTNVNWGGSAGVISKINQAFKEGDYDYEVRLVNGEIIFYHLKALKDDFVKILDPSSGTTPFAVGRVPADTDFNTRLNYSRLSDNTFYDIETGEQKPNMSGIAYDNGMGTIMMNGSPIGSINYDTGQISINLGYRTEFQVGYAFNSAHAGKMKSVVSTVNTIRKISARSLNAKINGSLKVITYS